MSSPVVARTSPYLITLEAGRTYMWCACGRSKRQPFCDGSHRGTGFEPVQYVATRSEEVLFCGCKHTATAPFCDGTHNNLPGGAPLDNPDSAANRNISLVRERTEARTMLDGNCYVISTAKAKAETRGALRYSYLISRELGALYQTQILMEVENGVSPPMTFADRHVILFIGAGAGVMRISGRDFAVNAGDGIYVRPDEAFQLLPDAGSKLRAFVSACPLGEVVWLENMPDNFDARFPRRTVPVDIAQRNAMGPRYFQCLVDKRIGSDVITQFIGHIPISKATPHRHLYEESLIVLSGEGYVWTDELKARIGAGDVIFLPRKQLHSLQSTAPGGMDVVGVIFPGDNPSINFY